MWYDDKVIILGDHFEQLKPPSCPSPLSSKPSTKLMAWFRVKVKGSRTDGGALLEKQEAHG